MEDELYHYGIKGQKWGVRRFQNLDGSLTALGKAMRSGIGKAAATNASVADALDALNKKGVLDFVDSKADAPFSAVKEALSNKEFRDKATQLVDDYKSTAFGNLDESISKIRRYSSMVAGMRKNEPFVKINDTSKPWLETFGRDMMGWNNIAGVEDKALIPAAKKFVDYISANPDKGIDLGKVYYMHNPYIGQRIANSFRISDRAFTEDDNLQLSREAGSAYLKSLADTGYLSNYGWDKPMKFSTVDGMKVNAVIYANGGGVQNGASPSFTAEMKRQAREVQDAIETTGRLPTIDTSVPYKKINVGFPTYSLDNEYEAKFRAWPFDHADESEDYLAHHGIKGQKWGERKYQNPDGSLTALGRVRYGVGKARDAAGGVANAARKKLRPTDADLDDKIRSQASKRAHKQKENQLRELSGKKKKMKDMSDVEVAEELRSRQMRNQLKAMREADSPLYRGKEFASGAAKSAGLAVLRGTGSVLKGGVDIAGTLVKEGALKAGRNFINDALATDAERAKTNNDMFKNLVEASKNAQELDYVNSKEYAQDRAAQRDADRIKLAKSAMDDKLTTAQKGEEYRYVSSGQYAQDQSVKRQADYWKKMEDASLSQKKFRDNSEALMGKGKTFLEEMASKTKTEADIAQNKAKWAKSNLEYESYTGGKQARKKAMKRLNDTSNASKGKMPSS